MKKAILTLINGAGLFAPFRQANRNKTLIVTYHRFAQTDDGHSTSATAFEEQLRYLKNHYSLVPLSLIQDNLTLGVQLPPRAAAVTIDDGFSDAFEVALPILKRYSVPAALFVITDFVDRRTWLWTDKLRYLMTRSPDRETTLRVQGREFIFRLHNESARYAAAGSVNSLLKTFSAEAVDKAIEDISTQLNVELPALPPCEYGSVTWEQVLEMEASGIEIGSHTVTHPILPNVSNEQLKRELNLSRIRLENVLNHSVSLFCYPNGSYDKRTRQAVADAGYKCAVTTKPMLNNRTSDPLALSRVPAELDLAHFVQTTSGFEELKTSLRGR